MVHVRAVCVQVESNAQRSARLEALLLAGAPSPDAIQAATQVALAQTITSIPGSGVLKEHFPDWHPVWNDDFVRMGEAFLGKAKSARARARLLKRAKARAT